MKRIFIISATLLLIGCTGSQKLAYLNNLPTINGEETFTLEIPDYRIQSRDILYITVKAMTPNGSIVDFLATTGSYGGTYVSQGESGGYIFGYNVNSEGDVVLPAIGPVKVKGLTLEESKRQIQVSVDSVFKNATVECKLLSFKYTVMGEVNTPGTYINYNNYLTIFEAIGRAGGINDYGRRDHIMVIRPTNEGSRTYRLDLQNKKLLSSEAYYLLPNDVIIVEPASHKIFNINLPTISFILTSVTSAITTTLLLINYLKK